MTREVVPLSRIPKVTRSKIFPSIYLTQIFRVHGPIEKDSAKYGVLGSYMSRRDRVAFLKWWRGEGAAHYARWLWRTKQTSATLRTDGDLVVNDPPSGNRLTLYILGEKKLLVVKAKKVRKPANQRSQP